MVTESKGDILFLLIARGGSKGIPGKNLQRIGGRSLIELRAVAARASRYCSRLILSTDDPAIQDEGRRLGVEVPFTRPPALASDTASSTDVVLHAMDWIEQTEGRRYEGVMLLEAAAPFARPDHLDEAVALFHRRDASLVVGMREMEVSSCFVGTMDARGGIGGIVTSIKDMAIHRRQDAPMEFTMNGALYLMRWESLRESRQIYADAETSYGLVMDRFHSVEIDEPIDLAYARFLVDQGYLDLAPWGGERL